MGRNRCACMCSTGYHSSILLLDWWMGTQIFVGYITQVGQPIIWMLIYVFITAMVVYKGVNKGIEKYSKILMPILFVLIAGISVFSLTLKHTNADGVTRTGMQGLAIYLIPNFRGMTVKSFLSFLIRL